MAADDRPLHADHGLSLHPVGDARNIGCHTLCAASISHGDHFGIAVPGGDNGVYPERFGAFAMNLQDVPEDCINVIDVDTLSGSFPTISVDNISASLNAAIWYETGVLELIQNGSGSGSYAGATGNR
ncbi:hypothetical protein AB1M95_04810 [Sulfitobacter sp. LCG007]